jgi:hypothetical protein
MRDSPLNTYVNIKSLAQYMQQKVQSTKYQPKSFPLNCIAIGISIHIGEVLSEQAVQDALIYGRYLDKFYWKAMRCFVSTQWRLRQIAAVRVNARSGLLSKQSYFALPLFRFDGMKEVFKRYLTKEKQRREAVCGGGGGGCFGQIATYLQTTK